MDEILPSSPPEPMNRSSGSFEPPAGIIRIQPRTVETCVGTIRRWNSVPIFQRTFLIIGLVELTVSLIYASYSMLSNLLSKSETSGEDFILATVLTINIVFCYLHIFDGVMREKPYDVLVFALANATVLIYVVENYAFRCWQFGNLCFHGVKMSRLIFTSIITPPVIVMAGVVMYQLNRGEFIFRIVGASASLQKACRILFAAISFVLLDLQIQLSMLTVLVYDRIKAKDLPEIAAISCDVPFSILWAFGSYIALRLESVKFVVFIVVFSCVEPAYNIYSMYYAHFKIYDSSHELLDIAILSIGSLMLLVRALHIYLLIRCSRNFGRSLKYLVFSNVRIDAESRPLLG